MVEELRNHDATPTDEERDWMDFDPFSVAVQLIAVAVLGATIGIYASMLVDQEPKPKPIPASVAAFRPLYQQLHEHLEVRSLLRAH